jgi:hypothetical protein
VVTSGVGSARIRTRGGYHQVRKEEGEGKEEESGPESLYTERNLQRVHHYEQSFGDEIHRPERQPRGVGCWRVWCAMGTHE